MSEKPSQIFLPRHLRNGDEVVSAVNRIQGDNHELYLDVVILRCLKMEMSEDGDLT